MKRLQRVIRVLVGLVAGAPILAAVNSTSTAQVVIGGSGRPDVQVNLGVLDNLPPSGPVLEGRAPTHLRRPGIASKGTKAKTAAVPHRATATPKHVAAKPKPTREATKHAPANPAKPVRTAAREEAAPAEKPKEAVAAPSLAPQAEPAAATKIAEPPPATEPVPAAKPVPEPPPAASSPATQAATASTTLAPEPPPASPAPAPEERAQASPPPPASSGGGIVAGGLLAGASDANQPLERVDVPSRGKLSASSGQRTAALSPPAATASINGLRVTFTGSSADLPPAAQAELAALAQQLAGNTDRIILSGYASGDASSGAKRVALSRVLAVRAFLVERNVPQPRIDVRAVGTASEGAPERVDIAKIGR